MRTAVVGFGIGFVIGLGRALFGGVGAAHAAAPCELDSASACYERGVAAFKAQDAAAADWFARACESGAAEGCTELGFLLMEGMLTARDDVRARVVSLRACELGSGLGCNNAFVLVRDGRGGGKDAAELRRLADRSCTLDDGEGCYLAAAVFGEPIGGALDEARADAALTKSCKLGFGMACDVVGRRALEGSFGVDKDEGRGVRLIAKACELGHGPACADVAVWIREGAHGLKRDLAKAEAVAGQGCELGDARACELKRAIADEGKGGTLTAELARRSSKRALLKRTSGNAPPVGAVGEVARVVVAVDGANGVVRTVLGAFVVKRVDGDTLELEVTRDDVGTRDKAGSWSPGAVMTLTWTRAPASPVP